MKKASLLCIFGAIGVLLGASTALADMMSGTHVLYTPAMNLAAMYQNTYAGVVGGIFLTSFSTFPYVDWLGYADPNDQGLKDSHVVSLYADGGVEGGGEHLIAQVTVPAGTATPWYDGYRWV